MRCGANLMTDMPAMAAGSQMQMNQVLVGMDFYPVIKGMRVIFNLLKPLKRGNCKTHESKNPRSKNGV